LRASCRLDLAKLGPPFGDRHIAPGDAHRLVAAFRAKALLLHAHDVRAEVELGHALDALGGEASVVDTFADACVNERRVDEVSPLLADPLKPFLGLEGLALSRDAYLTREHDRALFGLAPRAEQAENGQGDRKRAPRLFLLSCVRLRSI
jgi:hypothetical protein